MRSLFLLPVLLAGAAMPLGAQTTTMPPAGGAQAEQPMTPGTGTPTDGSSVSDPMPGASPPDAPMPPEGAAPPSGAMEAPAPPAPPAPPMGDSTDPNAGVPTGAVPPAAAGMEPAPAGAPTFPNAPVGSAHNPVVVGGNMTPPPQAQKEYPVCTKTITDSCINPREARRQGR